MNTKTTITMAFFLVVLVMGLYIVRSQSRTAPVDAATTAAMKPSPTSRDLLKEKLGDVVKITVKRKDHEDWVFERSGGGADSATVEWRLTAPTEMKVVRFEPDRISRQLTTLAYEVSHRKGAPGAASAADAGLEPPQAVVTLLDDKGNSATIEIGKPASEDSTYVRLAGTDEIAVAKANLQKLFKNRLVEYREQNLWNFDAKNVTRIEFEDRTNPAAPTTYTFAPQGSGWVMESPLPAKATNKVADAVRDLSRLRAVQWVSDDASKLPLFGLEPAPLTVRVTVEKPVEAPEPAKTAADGEGPSSEGADEAPAEKQPPRIEKNVYVLQLSDRSPIGEDTKVYFRAGDETAAGTILKNMADKFRPVLAEWRDMHLTTAEVTAANRIEITVGGAPNVLEKKDGRWTAGADHAPADDSAVTAFLGAIRDLNAVSFVDAAAEPAVATAFASPQADIRLTLPGAEAPERMTVGDYTDAAAKRLVYVRRNDSATVAKVRASDIATLVQDAQAYRDRTIIELPSSEVERVAFSLVGPSSDGGRMEWTLGRDGSYWSIVEPVPAAARADRVNALIEAIAQLRAERVVATGDQGSAFGLHDPKARLVITRKRSDSADSAEGENASGAGEGGSKIELLATEHEGKFYAKRTDRPLIYEITGSFYGQLSTELRADSVWTFDEAKVTSFAVRQGDESHAFERKNGKWVYQAEPDLPLDQKKVADLLLRVRDLKTERYVSHGASANPAFGLEQPKHEVRVTLDDGSIMTLRVSANQPPKEPATLGFYAAVADRPGVFLLDAPSIDRFRIDLAQLERK